MTIANAQDTGAFCPAALDDMGLDVYEFRVYMRLCRRAGSGVAWESHQKIAEGCLIGRKKVVEVMASLEAKGLISTEKRHGLTSFVTILPLQDTNGQPVSPRHNPVSVRDNPVSQEHTPLCPTDTPTCVSQTHKGTPMKVLPFKESQEDALPLGRSNRFIPPTVEEVEAYLREQNVADPTANALKFHAHYEASDWKRGKTPIKNWKACVRTWDLPKVQPRRAFEVAT